MTRYDLHDVALEVHQSGDGGPLLLLHGFTGTGRTWSHLASDLDGYRVIAPDLLGHGASDAPADPARYDLALQARDLASLLDHLGATPADVVGYSMGARIAVRLVLDHPQLVRRLVLESPSPGMARRRERADRLAADLALADEIERDGVEAFVDRWEELELFATQVLLPPEVREAIRAERLSQRAVGLANAVRGAGQGAMAPVHEDLRRITAPTLVIAGARDAVGAERAADVARRIPGARLETIESAGHAPHLETPDEFGRLVADFLSTT